MAIESAGGHHDSGQRSIELLYPQPVQMDTNVASGGCLPNRGKNRVVGLGSSQK
jgi:hypothetical protein